MFWRNTTHTQPANAFAALNYSPSDILIEIAKSLDSLSDILNFALTSNFVYSSVCSVLYEKVTLNNVQQCFHTLSMLQRRPEIARHVRELVVRPHTNKKTQQGVAVSALASAAVRDTAATMCLDALTKFSWDGEERPYHEDMWFALRKGCPQLRYIGTSVGAHLPSQNSHLFDFVDLTGFALMFRRGFYDMHMDMFLDEDNPTSRQLWDMLIRQCPNLEELAIEGVSPLPTDAHLLVEGRWPRLRKLSLGDVSIDWLHGPVDPTQKRPFIAWLEAHPNLESLDLSRHTIQSAHLSNLNSTRLQLSSFSGTMQQLQALPHIHSFLKSVSFREPLLTRDISPQGVAGLLQGLSNLTELKISFMLHSMYDSGNLLRSLIASCPQLQHLDLTCGSRPSFQIDAFSKTVRGFTKLRSLRLTLVKYPGDESLSAGAVRIAKCNPRLTKFSLTFISPSYPLPLPFGLPFFGLPLPYISRSSGSFKLTTDHHGLPLSLACQEQYRIVWPWGLGSSLWSKKYVSDLRPLSSPARQKSGVKGVLGLLCERSLAGEEIRMIVFCALLVTLAIWGFAVNQGRTFFPRPAHIDIPVRVGGVGILASDAQLRFSRGTVPRPRLTATA